MSIKWMSVAWDHAKDVNGTGLLVLLCLADHSNDDGTCYPSVARIAKLCRTTPRNVQYILTNLEALGWVVRNLRGGRSTLYQLTLPGPIQAVEGEVGFGVQSLRGEGDFVFTPQSSSPITIKEPTTASGGVVEVTTGETSPPTDERSMIEQPFPAFAKAALGAITEAQAAEWVSAWRTAHEVGREWDPLGNLTKYLARCKDRKTTPSPTEWTRWFVEDEHKARQFAREAAASATEETPHQWWE